MGLNSTKVPVLITMNCHGAKIIDNSPWTGVMMLGDNSSKSVKGIK